MIKVFGQTDTTFTSNGDIVIKPLKAKVHQEIDSDYYLDIEVGIEYIDWITQGRIVVVEINDGTWQAFRIRNVTQTGKRISARCWHVFYDSLYTYYVEACPAVQSQSCYTILNTLKANTVPTPPFTFDSTLSISSGFVSSWFEPLYNGIMKTMELSDGHLKRNNYDCQIVSSVGRDNGVVIQYGKNLKDISCVENWDNVCTRLFPWGNNGVYISESGHHYINSPYASYPIRYTKAVTFNQDYIKRENYSTEAQYETACETDLVNVADKYLKEHANPEVSYTLKASIDKISGVGDTIEVIDERLGLDLMTNVTSYDYDCLTKRFTEVSFGNFIKTAKGMGITVSGLLDNQENAVVSGKRLKFNDNNSVTWENLTSQPT